MVLGWFALCGCRDVVEVSIHGHGQTDCWEIINVDLTSCEVVGGGMFDELATADDVCGVEVLEIFRALWCISDPTDANTGSITLALNRSVQASASADSGVTVVGRSCFRLFCFLLNGSHGKTFHALLNYSNSILADVEQRFLVKSSRSTNTLAFFSAASAVGISNK